MTTGPDDTCTASNIAASKQSILPQVANIVASSTPCREPLPHTDTHTHTHTHPCKLSPLPWEQLQGGHTAGACTRFVAWVAGYGEGSARGEGAGPERTASRAVDARGLAHVSPAPTKAAGPGQKQAE